MSTVEMGHFSSWASMAYYEEGPSGLAGESVIREEPKQNPIKLFCRTRNKDSASEVTSCFGTFMTRFGFEKNWTSGSISGLEYQVRTVFI